MLRPIAVLALALVWTACDAIDNQAQRDFEAAAFLGSPSGYTETSATGEVVQADPNDWRVAPVVAGRVQVITPPYPNAATRGSRVTVQLYTDGVPGGLALYTITPQGDLRLVASRTDATAVGFYDLTFFGSEATAGASSGLYRLVILDGRERVLTYGDLLVSD